MRVTPEDIRRFIQEGKYVRFAAGQYNDEKVKKRFDIPSEETLVVFFLTKSLRSIFDIAMVFTDQKMYSLGAKKKSILEIGKPPCVSISYSAFSHAFTAFDDKACVFYNEKQTDVFLRRPLFLDQDEWQKASKELLSLMSAIHFSMQEDSAYRQEFQKSCYSFTSYISEKVERGDSLKNEYEKAILKRTPLLQEAYCKLLIHDFLLEELAEEIPRCDEAVKKHLTEYVDFYFEKCRNARSHFTRDMIYNRLKNLDIMQKRDAEDEVSLKLISLRGQFLAYYQVWGNPFLPSETISASALHDLAGKSEVKELVKFSGVLGSYRMASILQDMEGNDVFSIKKLADGYDALGLNALHYAIITGREEEAKNNVTYYKLSHPSWYEAEFEFDPFDYSFLSYYLGKKDLGAYLLENSGVIGSLNKTVESLRRLRKSQEAVYHLKNSYIYGAERKVNQARQKASNRDSMDNHLHSISYAERRISQLKENAERSKQRLIEIEQDIERIERILQEKKTYFYSNINKWIENFGDTSEPQSVLLRQLYNDSRALLQFLLSIEKHIVVLEQSDGYCIRLNIPEYRRKESSYRNTMSRPYGNSWFSPEAHIDYTRLKEEYYAYAKLYHPDNSADAATIFREINDERADIINSMK